jgi:oxygen-dependent protoporphyrinogen oxidase
LVDPLIGGINAGDTDRLSIDAVAPQIAAAARRDRSLTRALRSLPPPAPGPVFFTLPGGMARLVDALVAAITRHGGEVRTGAPVASLDDLDADGVVLAVPAFAAAPLLEPVAPSVAATLAAIEYSSVTLVAFAFPDAAVDRPLDASGFLVPRPEGLLMTACSWSSTKWAHLAAPGRFVLRVSAGRVGDERAAALSDEALVARLRDELGLTMGLRGEPLEVAVHRWPRAFPQYEPGHLSRMADAQAALPDRVALAGALLGGVGIPACIGTGRAAAARVRGEESAASR